ncbi:serine hydrolase domain-containing protein [Geomonas sp.]|uniref:serine hydrolase domain-containing protein n=1 Tax=Geomonas sp. TaxID=2651584 RepID=UPI002B46501D|nr:serine hydrolase domain-containing protein [Geomonas sp.]HJV36752.1 serine hydrolase domain-containing protein [Geomonas sp.]
MSPAAACASSIDGILDRAIAQNLIAGGVALIGNRDGIIATAARGQLNPATGSKALDERTIFDLASLTKVIATTPAIMKLLDQGVISLSDPIARWFPEFAEAGHGDITVLSLLTHTSGLDDFSISPEQPIQYAVRKAAAEKCRAGSRFHYADINFILLGELVHRVSGQTLDAFCQSQIFGPLGAQETMFLPPRELAASIAPTSGYQPGVVQDPNARKLGGVAGHAGLFSSAYDLSLYARMILGGGAVGDKRILSQQIIGQMTTPYGCSNGSVKRGLGWDIQSPFSAPKGNYFSEASFGHTGYSGSSIWIDPKQDLFVILLTRRVNYRDTHDFNKLRRDVSTVAAADLKGAADLRPLAPSSAVASLPAQVDQAVTNDIKVYEENGILVATNLHKVSEESQPRPQHHQRLAKLEKRCSKVSVKRGARVMRVARADVRRSLHHKKKQVVRG